MPAPWTTASRGKTADVLASTRRTVDRLERRLEKCEVRPTDADRRRAVRALARAAALAAPDGPPPGCPLADGDARRWFKVRCGCDLSAAGVGAVLDFFPDFVDPDLPAEWLVAPRA